MALFSCDPHFKRIRIRSGLQHPDIVIRFQHQGRQAFQTVHQMVIIYSEIRHYCTGRSPVGYPETYRIRSIMARPKSCDLKISDAKHLILPDRTEQTAFFCKDSLAKKRRCGPGSRINRDLRCLFQHGQRRNMVIVLMSDQDSCQVVQRQLQFFQSLQDPFPADPGINENMGAAASYIGGIAAASAGDIHHSHKTLVLPAGSF